MWYPKNGTLRTQEVDLLDPEHGLFEPCSFNPPTKLKVHFSADLIRVLHHPLPWLWVWTKISCQCSLRQLINDIWIVYHTLIWRACTHMAGYSTVPHSFDTQVCVWFYLWSHPRIRSEWLHCGEHCYIPPPCLTGSPFDPFWKRLNYKNQSSHIAMSLKENVPRWCAQPGEFAKYIWILLQNMFFNVFLHVDCL